MTAIGAARSSGQGVGHDQDGHRAHRLAADGPGDAGQGERERDERHGEPVGCAHERGSGCLCLFDQAHHARVRRLLGQCGGDDVHRMAGVHHAAANVLTRQALGR